MGWTRSPTCRTVGIARQMPMKVSSRDCLQLANRRNPPSESRHRMSEPNTVSAAGQVQALTPDAIMQLGLAFWGSTTLLSAVELKLFAALSEAAPLDAEELRERLGLHPRSARDFFDAL